MKQYRNQELSALIDTYIHSERDRAILKRKLIDGITYDALAEEFHYSSRHLQRIVYKAENILFKYLES